MKKFVKGSLITAGILFAVGLVFCFISTLIGGQRLIRAIKEEDILDEKIEVFVDEVGNVVYEATDGRWGYSFKESYPRELTVNGQIMNGGSMEEKLSLSDIQELQLDVGAGILYLQEKETADNTIDISIKGLGGCTYKTEDGRLYVEGFRGIKTLIGNVAQDNVITISVPKNCRFEKVETEVGAGAMDIQGVNVGKLKTEIGAGECRIYQVNVNEFSAEIGAGSLEVTGTNAGTVELDVSMGECIYQGSVTGDMDVECSMGNIELSLEGKEEDHNYRVECSAGNIDIGNLSFSALAAERVVNHNADSNFDIDCNMGNITINFAE